MPSWFSPLWNFLQDANNQHVLAWLGGGVAIAAGPVWVVVKFFAEQRKEAEEKKALERRLASEIAWKNDLIILLTKCLMALPLRLLDGEPKRTRPPAAGQAAVGAAWGVIKFLADQRRKANKKKALEKRLARETAWKNDLIMLF